MARRTSKDKVDLWTGRVDAAEKVYKKWEDKYSPSILWDYYLGNQWSQDSASDEEGRRRYVINLVFPTIETQLPSQLFYYPKYVVRPSPIMGSTPNSQAAARAKLQEDTLNSSVRDERLGFKEETFLGLLESYFRFGVIEVGYSGDWIDNPEAGKPILKENSEDPVMDSEGKEVLSPEQILKKERVYFKRIPASHFRVSANAHNQLSRCDWVGYYEWHYPEDLKRNKRYKNTNNIRATGRIGEDSSPTAAADADESDNLRNMVKVWKIFDIRGKKRYDFGEGNDKLFLEEDMELWEDGAPVIPFSVLRKHPRLDEFYPLPAVYNWISPQDELNETRNMQKVHRKRFLRKFIADPSIPDEELAKWESPVDGLLLRGKVDGIRPIADAPLDPTVVRNIPQTKEDFREISGVSGEQRGVADARTATQANIIENESRIRETKSKDQIATWLADIGKLALYYMRKRMVLPFWIAVNTDLQAEGAAVQIANVVEGYQRIQREDLDGVDTEIVVDITSLAPINEAQDRQDWIQALQLVADPMRGPMILASDVLLRKTMAMFNIRNEKEIEELRNFGVQAIQMMVASQQGPAAGPPGGGAAAPPQQGPTPSQEDIAAQLRQQMPG